MNPNGAPNKNVKMNLADMHWQVLRHRQKKTGKAGIYHQVFLAPGKLSERKSKFIMIAGAQRIVITAALTLVSG